MTMNSLLLSKSDENSKNRSWEASLDLETLPFLKDHCVQDMTILPGSSYIELALAAALAKGKRPYVLENVQFQNVFVLPENGSRKLLITLSPDAEGSSILRYFSEAAGKNSTDTSGMELASMRIPQEQPDINVPDTGHPDPEEIQVRCPEIISGHDFYAELRANGNQYGPDFQGIKQIWRGKGEALGRIHTSLSRNVELQDYHLHATVLDACTQVLTAINSNPGRTFVLVGFDRMLISESPGNQCWSHAYLTDGRGQDSDTLMGNVHLLNDEGKVMVDLLGIRFRYLEYAQNEEELDNQQRATVAVSATFTSEPMEETLQFWGKELETPFNIEFAPYNQIFQQLLDPGSLLSQNDSGLNVIMVRFEDWIRDQNHLHANFDTDQMNNLFGEHAKYTLPNQLEIAHLNQYETEYLYKEIFVDQCYLKHGIALKEGDCIIDIGANIGMFTLFIGQNCKNPTIYAFEPSPHTFKALNINANLYGSNVTAFNYGISDRAKEATFTFYEKSSVFSSFNADEVEDEKAIRAVVENMLRESGTSDESDLQQFVDELMEGRMNSKSFVCQLKSVSDIIRENNIEKIDLLKIDAEKSELDILRGIESDDWPKIRQMVLEVHDKEGHVIKEVNRLLQEKGFGFAIEEEDLLHNSGLYNIFATRSEEIKKESILQSSSTEKEKIIRENVHNLVVALKSAAERSAAPHLVITCPASPSSAANADYMRIHEEMETFLLAELGNLTNVFLVKTADLNSTYPVKDYYDPHGDKLGHVPYTPAFFSALGSMTARKLHTIQGTPYKVVVLDCDQTLWKGVCGEDGPLGIEIDQPRKLLQEFMVNQQDAGMVICLCSKNSEEDVKAVFDHHPEMPLQQKYIVTSRINWQPKSENIKSLAAELQLGLDSFIFVDDNPIECAEVQVNCPEVLTLQLPGDPADIPVFLNHVWAFDHLKITEEDKKRTTLYQQNFKREHLRQASLTLNDFLSGLELNVNISQPVKQNMSRVSQLTQRTNQFNFTTIRRSEADIEQLLQNEKMECLICEVSDRFGDYGLVGVILFEMKNEAVKVDTFLLSCRVLGRGVEHQMLARLGEMAGEHGLDRVDITYQPTKKNQPALDFLNSVASPYKSPAKDGFLFSVPAEYAGTITYMPDRPDSVPFCEPTDASSSDARVACQQMPAISRKTELQSHIASSLNSTKQIIKAVESRAVKQKRKAKSEYVAPNNELERSITKIWQQVLGIEKVGINDNFSELGGSSLQGVQLIARLQKELNVDISIVSLFESPTISSMAKMLGTAGREEQNQRLEIIRDRGQKRRARSRSRTER